MKKKAAATHDMSIEAAGDRDVVVVRAFDARAADVYAAYVSAHLMAQWLGPRSWTMTTCELEPRVGGTYRYVWSRGNEKLGMRGTFLEVEPNRRLVTTERFDEAWYPGEARGAVDFAERDGVTTMTMTLTYPSREARDGVMASPMRGGLAEGYQRLDELLTMTTSTKQAA